MPELRSKDERTGRMTREEAIKLLVNATYSDEWQGNEQLTKANLMAIEALQREEHLVELEAKAVAIIKSERHGEWKEKETHLNEGDCEITEWQSARCSKCGKYHTTPYMYSFNNFNFCPNCGAKMDK